jgi:hypothetical protein
VCFVWVTERPEAETNAKMSKVSGFRTVEVDVRLAWIFAICLKAVSLPSRTRGWLLRWLFLCRFLLSLWCDTVHLFSASGG